jgi:hypothetical protein
MTVVSKLTVQNKHQTMAFAEWAQNNKVSFNYVWFSDKAHFHLDGVRFWASEIPRVICEQVHRALRTTVRDAISSHGLLGPIFFKQTVSSECY